jgi:two-component system chemotaxis response regulator CheY
MKRILVIDDSKTIRKAIRHILEPMGFLVEEAEDGAKAIEQVIGGFAPDCVLCDIDMPVMDGLTFVSVLRGTPGVTQPPVIMCTTHNTFEKIQDALGRGADEYIMKPFDADIIDAKLTACGVR